MVEFDVLISIRLAMTFEKTTLFCFYHGAPGFRFGGASLLAFKEMTFGTAFKIATWLILPVVICLSQRLSHACLSINNFTVKLRMAH
jgi:hypothetical protein